jgi:hypothetical protein
VKTTPHPSCLCLYIPRTRTSKSRRAAALQLLYHGTLRNPSVRAWEGCARCHPAVLVRRKPFISPVGQGCRSVGWAVSYTLTSACPRERFACWPGWVPGFGGVGYGRAGGTVVNPYPPCFTARRPTPTGPIPPHLSVRQTLRYNLHHTHLPCARVFLPACGPSLTHPWSEFKLQGPEATSVRHDLACCCLLPSGRVEARRGGFGSAP